MLYNEYKIRRKNVTKAIKNQKLKYYEYKFSNAIGSKQTWKQVREIGIGKQNNPITESVNVNDVNEKFVNLSAPCGNICYELYNTRTLNTLPSFNFECVDECDVVQSILDVKSNAVGFDGIHPKF